MYDSSSTESIHELSSEWADDKPHDRVDAEHEADAVFINSLLLELIREERSNNRVANVLEGKSSGHKKDRLVA